MDRLLVQDQAPAAVEAIQIEAMTPKYSEFTIYPYKAIYIFASRFNKSMND